ncbi:hypothetical protein D3C72_1912540 [compost metagenome]
MTPSACQASSSACAMALGFSSIQPTRLNRASGCRARTRRAAATYSRTPLSASSLAIMRKRGVGGSGAGVYSSISTPEPLTTNDGTVGERICCMRNRA